METSARNKQPVPFHALIAAAGSGTRLGGSLPKQYQKIGKKTVLRHTIEKFLSCDGLVSLCVIIDPSHAALFEESVRGLGSIRSCHGSDTRNKSIYNGLLDLSHVKNDEIILIHDAARPFISPEKIQEVAESAARDGAASVALPVADTLYNATQESYVDRHGLWAMQTPQGFGYGLIRRAHERAREQARAGAEAGWTDDTSLAVAAGHRITLVPGSRLNFKITTPEDWDMAEALMTQYLMTHPIMTPSLTGGDAQFPVTRTGLGFDVHAFDDTGARTGSVRLCGIDVPHPRGLAGHSDADVGLHAVTDALLGAIAAGDIGQHFPPSDERWRDRDSAHFLAHAAALVREAGGQIVNIDLTVICEAPKLGPHRDVMQRRMAEICGLDPSQVGIKATTSERLGFTGRGEGIAAQAVATVILPPALARPG